MAEKKVVIFGSIIVILGGVVFLMLWRSHVMGSGARLSAEALVAVSADGTPMPAPAAQAAGNRLPENTAIQETGGKLVSLTLNPYPPTVAKASVFEVRVTDANGQAISGAT